MSLEPMMAPCTILILGGTGDARALAALLDEFDVILSLAGRTANPQAQPGRARSGGFGGAEGLARYLKAEGVDILVDATHPFAARISANAVAASDAVGIPLLKLERPEWQMEEGDLWIAARDTAHAVSLLGDQPKTVFLAIGRQEVAPFTGAGRHRYIVRSVEPVDPGNLPAGATVILERGPFDEAAELRLLKAHGVDIVVSKNSGGAATYGKIAAARALGIAVMMIERPPLIAGECVSNVAEAAARVVHLAGVSRKRGE